MTTGRALENKACWRQRTIFITRGRERMRESSTERERETVPYGSGYQNRGCEGALGGPQEIGRKEKKIFFF